MSTVRKCHTQRWKYLGPINELGQGNICMMSKDGESFETAVRSVLELDPREVAGVRRRASTELDCQGRCVVR